jgi:hypothetical protein
VNELMLITTRPRRLHRWIRVLNVNTCISWPPLNGILVLDFYIISTLVRLCRISSSLKETPSLTISRWLSWNWKPPIWWMKRVTQLSQVYKVGNEKSWSKMILENEV